MSKAVNGFSVRAIFPILVRVAGSNTIHLTVNLEENLWDYVTAFGVDGDGILVAYDGTIYTWNEGMAMEGMTPEALKQMNIIEITEDEFLNKTFE